MPKKKPKTKKIKKTKLPKIPANMTEEEVVETIERVATRLAYKFRFGYFDLEDIKQQASYEAWKGMANYDGKRPLENFLAIHIKNRLCNYKRDNYERREKPCLKCPLNAYVDGECTAYSELMECKWYAGWMQRNTAKKNLMSPIEINHVRDESENNMKTGDTTVGSAMNNELSELIDRELPVHLRADYLRLKDGVSVPKKRREELIAVLQQIVYNVGQEASDG